MKNCQACGIDFEGRRDAKTCSPRCRKRLQRLNAQTLTGPGAAAADPVAFAPAAVSTPATPPEPATSTPSLGTTAVAGSELSTPADWPVTGGAFSQIHGALQGTAHVTEPEPEPKSLYTPAEPQTAPAYQEWPEVAAPAASASAVAPNLDSPLETDYQLMEKEPAATPGQPHIGPVTYSPPPLSDLAKVEAGVGPAEFEVTKPVMTPPVILPQPIESPQAAPPPPPPADIAQTDTEGYYTRRWVPAVMVLLLLLIGASGWLGWTNRAAIAQLFNKLGQQEDQLAALQQSAEIIDLKVEDLEVTGEAIINKLTVTGSSNLESVTTQNFYGDQVTGGSGTFESLLVTGDSELQGALTVGGIANFSSDVQVEGTITANFLAGDGAALTNLNASAISHGTLADARLTSNVALLDRNNQIFTGANVVRPTTNTVTAFQVQNSASTAVLSVDTTNNRVGINNASPAYALDVAGTVNLTGNGLVGGNIIVTGQGSFAHAPTLAHMFAPWPSGGTSNFADASLLVNPGTSVADGNLLVLAVNDVAKFVIDAEGDIFANNLVLTGSTSTGSNTVAGDLTVEGNTILGDAPTDTLTVEANAIFNTLGAAGSTALCQNGSNQLATCAGSGGTDPSATLQNAYVNGNTIDTTEADGNIVFTLADTATDHDFIVNLQGTGNTFEVQDSGVASAIFADGGRAAFGPTATLNQSANVLGLTIPTQSTISVQEQFNTYTVGSAFHTGLNVQAVANPDIASTQTIGAILNGRSLAANSQNLTTIAGASVWGEHLGSGTLTNLYGQSTAAYHSSAVTVTSAYGISSQAINLDGGTITNAHGIFAESVNSGTVANTTTNAYGGRFRVRNSNATGTITNGYGIQIQSASNSGTFTNNYGLYIQDQSAVGSTDSFNLYSAGANSKNYFQGSIGIGDTAPSTKLSLGGTGTANGITLGDDAAGPVNLYRSATDTLKTDDAFQAGGRLTLTGGDGITFSTGGAVNINAGAQQLTVASTGLLLQSGGVTRLQLAGTEIRVGNTSTSMSANHVLQALSGATNQIPLGAKGFAGQTADLFQLQDSGGVILTAFDSAGKLVFGPSGSQDTNLYRSAANTLKTDDAFVVGTLGSGGTVALCSNAGQISTCSGSGGSDPSVTLQNAYANGNTITTTNARDISITLADAGATDSNFLINFAAGATGNKFAVQEGGTDVFSIPKGGTPTFAGSLLAGSYQTSAGSFTFQSGVNSQQVIIAGGGGATNGGNIELYGGSHATLNDVIRYDGRQHIFRNQSGANSVFTIDTNNSSSSQTVLLKPVTNSTTAFQVQPASSTTPVLNVDTTNSRVGIGTDAPTNPLHIAVSDNATTYANINAVISIQNLNTTNNNAAIISFRTQDTNGNGVAGARIGSVFSSHSVGGVSGNLIFETNNSGSFTEKVRIEADGNVGIGDTAPSTKLSLGGTGTANGITLGDDAASPVNLYRSAADTLKTDDAFVVGTLGTGGTTTLCSNAGQISTCSGSGGTPTSVTLQNAYVNGNTIDTTEADGNIAFTLTDTASDHDFIVNLQGTGNTFEIQDGGTPFFKAIDGGFVGISTASPAHLLSVGTLAVADANAAVAISTGASANKGLLIQASTVGQSGNLLVLQNSAGADMFSVSPAGNAVIAGTTTATGNLFVGAASLVAPFSVNTASQIVRIGTGATNNAVLNMFASDGDTGSITYDTSDRWLIQGGNILMNSSGQTLQLSGDQSRVAIGDAASTTAATSLHVAETYSDTSGTTWNINTRNTVSALAGAATTNAGGVHGEVLIAGSEANNITGITKGLQGTITHSGTGTLSSASGVRSNIDAQSASGSLITDAFGYYTQIRATTAASTIQNAYGLYIDNRSETGTITNDWGVYQAGGGDGEKNMFGGDTRIGTLLGAGSTPGATLDVDMINATSVTAEKIQILSGNTSQTLTDGTTIASWRHNQFIAPTLNGVAGGGTETVTNAATAYIDAAPSGTNIAITNAYALWVDAGDVRFDGDLDIQGGDLTTNQTTFNLLNTTATTINFAGAATTLNLGANTGTTSIDNNLFIEDKLRLGLDSRTIADNGAGTNATLTLNPTSAFVAITCNDANGCDITMDEAAPVTIGDLVFIVTAGAVNTNFADTTNVSELAGAFAAGDRDSITMIYAGNAWIETSRSNN